MRGVKIAIGLIVAGGIAYGVMYFRQNLMVSLPEYASLQQDPRWLEQGWQPADRAWYHHADQGTQTFGVPLEWFEALEQPTPSFGAVGLLSDPVYLDRFGFIPSGTEPGLPIGIAGKGVMLKRDGTPWQNPQTQENMTRVGFTCAACHTGRMTYKGTAILIDGGPALTDLGTFRTALGLSLLYTKYAPFRFDRFAKSVLGDGASDDAKAKLEEELDAALAQLRVVHELDDGIADRSVKEGYGRLDALNRIGNQVFGLDLGNHDNYMPTSAPTHYPHIWNASWFTWVQYNGSIEQPMVRNAGEALGVGVALNLTSADRPLYVSGLELGTIWKMEQMLAGTQPDESRGFSGLMSPPWPADILPPIKTELAEEGAGLYKEICQDCHLAPVTTGDFWSSKRWLAANEHGMRYLDLELVSLDHIGTDPAQARGMVERKVAVPPALGLSSDSFGVALGDLVEKAINQWYDGQTPPIEASLRVKMNGFRKNGIQAPLAYKVRPLNGIWATPPYLHNGSVPSLYALLSPVSERPKVFHLGNREYDDVNVGYSDEAIDNDFEFDTTIPGNSNSGHEFNNGPLTNGVIGRYLKPEERLALIEYLKTL